MTPLPPLDRLADAGSLNKSSGGMMALRAVGVLLVVGSALGAADRGYPIT
jgi:hypothetical protein